LNCLAWKTGEQELTMADRTTLGILGFIFSGVAVAVTAIAYVVVRDHVEGRLALEASVPALHATR
jgi:hypothetical protein